MNIQNMTSRREVKQQSTHRQGETATQKEARNRKQVTATHKKAFVLRSDWCEW